MKTTFFLLSAVSLTALSFIAAGAQAPVDLGSAENYVILAKTGVSTTGTTAILGNIGVSPIDSTAVTGFSLSLDATNVYATSPVLTGSVHAADYAVPTPSNLTTAIRDMETAYTDAAGRVLPDATELGAGNVSGMTLEPGLYKWGTSLLLTSAVTFAGGADEVWILQIAGDLDLTDGAIVHLTEGAHASNLFWQVAGEVRIGTTARFHGIVLSQTAIHLLTGASVSGRLLAQSAVTLDANSVTVAERVITDPIVTDPVITDPVVTDPVVAFDWRWFGSVDAPHFDEDAGEGWILHDEHGWLYADVSGDSVWLWEHIRQIWLWTNPAHYPTFYKESTREWIYYEEGGSPDFRWFFVHSGNVNGGTWVLITP